MIRQASINVLHDLICDVHEEYQIVLYQMCYYNSKATKSNLEYTK